MEQQQTQRVVLITGATGGLGTAVVRAFAAEGARLVLSARREQELAAVAQAAGLDDERVLLAPGDVTDGESVRAVVGRAGERFGAPEVVVHIAGGYVGGKSVADTDDATWQHMLGLNLTSAFLVARAALPAMLERGRGKLVFVSSRAGSVPAANRAAYAVSKGALEMLVRCLAEETRPRHINVNAVAPSVIDTPANRRSNPTANYASWVQPDSLAAIIRFLASAAANDVHGSIVPVAGP
jgi:NAD(P)-dependent dehydrogenase (short-subunit alcohol dehydrogenase family)